MRTTSVLTLVLLGLAIPTLGTAAEVVATPTDEATVQTIDAGAVTLVRFEIPEAAREGRITRAVLRYATDCPAKELVLMAHRAPETWDSRTVDASWWNTASTAIQKTDVATFETSDGSDGVVELDVTQWVRDWASSPAQNFGVVLRNPESEVETTSLATDVRLKAPTLRVLFRPKAAEE